MNLDTVSAGLQIKVYKDFESAEALKEDWNDLVSKTAAPNIFLTWEWVSTWWKWFGKGKELRLVVATEDSQVVGILPAWFGPISVVPGFSVPGIGLIGDGGPVCPEYLGPIVRERDANRVAGPMLGSLMAVSGRWRIFRLSDVLLEGAGVKRLIAYLSSDYSTHISEGERCAYRRLAGNFETFLSQLSRNRRKAFRQSLRKAEKEHNVQLKCYTAPDSVEEGFSILYDIYEKSVRGQNEIGGWSKADYRGFHQEVAKAFAEKGWLELFVLFFDDVPVAFLYCYQYCNVLLAYQTSFDARYRKLGPGSIILHLAIDAAINNGTKEIDLLRGEHDYKNYISSEERCQKRILVFRSRGISCIAFNARRKLSHLIRNLRE